MSASTSSGSLSDSRFHLVFVGSQEIKWGEMEILWGTTIPTCDRSLSVALVPAIIPGGLVFLFAGLMQVRERQL